MIKLTGKKHLLPLSRRGAIFLLVGILSFASVFNIFQTQSASAAQMIERSVTISTSQSDATSVEYDFDFETLTTETVGGIIIEFCTTPLGACTLPFDMQVNAATITDQTSFSSAFALDTATGDCTATAATTDTQVCLSRVAASETAGVESIILDGIKNPELTTPNYMTAYIRISLYNNDTFTPGTGGANIVHYGTVAAAFVNQLTTTGRVQERLEFCVASIDDSVVSASLPNSCGDLVNTWPTTTNVDLGIIDHTSVKAAPVDNSATDPANDDYGVLNVNTNASSGVAVTYFPEPQANVLSSDTDQLRSFRVVPTDCSAAAPPVYTDQCFENADRTTGEWIDPTTGEMFGMAIACVNTDNGGTAGLTDNFDPANGGTVNASYDGDYDGTTNTTGLDDGGDCENTDDESVNTYRWGYGYNGTTADSLISSSTVVDNEIIKVRFAATASPTTPTGSYSVTTTYIATATF